MKIAIDVSPVSKASTSAHKVRGVGAYINMLVNHIPKFDKKNEYVFIEDGNFPLNVDLVHYPYFDPFFITLPSKFQIRTVVTVHDLTPLIFPKYFPVGIKGRIKWVIQKSRLKKADLVITDSDSSRKDVGKIIGIPIEKIRTVYLAADEKFEKLDKGSWLLGIRERYKLPEDFLLYVGDATWNKNLPNLVSAVKKTKYRLVLVGKVWTGSVSEISNNPWNDDLRKVLKIIEGDDQFIRLGFVPDEELVKLYNIATALIMPSIYEGFGLPVLEAMTCGCPVITTQGGSLSEVADDAALYVDHENEESIRQGIDRIFGESRLREELSRKGLARAKEFSVAKMIKDIVNIYEEAHR